MATIVLSGLTEVWDVWNEQDVTDAVFDPRDALQLKADYLRSALPSALELIAALPSRPQPAVAGEGEPRLVSGVPSRSSDHRSQGCTATPAGP